MSINRLPLPLKIKVFVCEGDDVSTTGLREVMDDGKAKVHAVKCCVYQSVKRKGKGSSVALTYARLSCTFII